MFLLKLNVVLFVKNTNKIKQF